MPITIIEMQRLNIACKRILGSEEWERRVEVAWESLRDLEVVTADMLESALLDGMDISTGVHFDRKEAGALLALADYMGSGFVGEHTKTIAMIRRKVRQ
jgi:hypothetical protein